MIQLMEGLENLEVIPNTLESTFSSYLHNEVLAIDNYTKERHHSSFQGDAPLSILIKLNYIKLCCMSATCYF